MQTVLVTLIGPTRHIDLKLPAEVPTKELLPKLLELCGPPQQSLVEPSQWSLVIPGKNVALPHTHSLQACGVVDGAILFLHNPASLAVQQQQAQGPLFRPRALAPSADTGGIGVKWNMPNR